MQAIAALSTIPDRQYLLERVLTALRPQVDCLAVYLGRYTSVPPCVSDLADELTLDPTDRLGSEGKLSWTRSFDGLYLSVDDDLLYPPDYRAAFERAVDDDPRAIYCVQGARFSGPYRGFQHADEWLRWDQTSTTELALNMPAGGLMGHHTALQMPDRWPERNADDHQVAVWAQHHRIPVVGIPHRRDWLRYILSTDTTVYTIFREERAHGFARRNAILSQIPDWTTHVRPADLPVGPREGVDAPPERPCVDMVFPDSVL